MSVSMFLIPLLNILAVFGKGDSKPLFGKPLIIWKSSLPKKKKKNVSMVIKSAFSSVERSRVQCKRQLWGTNAGGRFLEQVQ